MEIEIKRDGRNYRKHSPKNKELIKKSLAELGAGRSILLDSENEIIAGNGVYEQAQNLNIPIKVIETDGTELVAIKRTDLLTKDDKRRKLAVLDNSTSDTSEFDFDLLQEDFSKLDLSQMGIEIEIDSDIQKQFEELEETENEKNPIAENHINEAVKKACGEILDQYKKLEGFSFYTPHIAKANFIKFLFYGKPYNRTNSIAFHPIQVKTNGDTHSLIEGIELVSNGGINPERVRWIVQDKIQNILNKPLAWAGTRMPVDFPAELARDLINEFGSNGKVLDPCAGWGGRLVGFLASTANEYQGVDASPYQVKGDLAIYECYKDVVNESKKVSIICSPFEKFEIKKEYYDMALTSPPYFDVEKYEGGEQSRNYGNYEKWKDCFYKILISKVHSALKKNGIFCLQVGNQRYPLEQDGIELARNIGFEYIGSRTTEMVNYQAKTSTETMERVVIFKKL